MKLEKMNDFFAARIDGYDEHMLKNVEGCAAAYTELSKYLPKNCKSLLDLGCGTGLELEKIFNIFPALRVTGIDLTAEMLEELKRKYAGKELNLICGDYFTVTFEGAPFSAAVSFQTMHHFVKKDKLQLYKKIYAALEQGGVYIECDYMVSSQAEEDALLNENIKLRKEQNISPEELYHFDIPCTVQNQILLLEQPDFPKCVRFSVKETQPLLSHKRHGKTSAVKNNCKYKSLCVCLFDMCVYMICDYVM